MNPTNQTHLGAGSLWSRMKAAADPRGALMLLLLLAVMTPGRAAAQAQDFGGLGTGLWRLICSFIKSPIVAVIVGVGILAAFVVAALNEDNGTLSKILKVVIFGMAILFIPMLLNMLGFDVANCG